MPNPVVLVGGLGFVGRNILEVLTRNKDFVDLQPVIIDDLSNACPGYESLSVPAFAGSYQSSEAADFLTSYAGVRKVYIFLAGETRVAESGERPHDFIAANISEPARFVTDVMKPGDQFILISTAGALFDGTFEISVDSSYCPKNFYGATKAAEEMILEKLVHQKGGEFSIVRMTNVFGRYSDNKKSAIHAFTRAAINGEKVTLNGDGKQTRDFVYAGDVGLGIATLASRMQRREAYKPINMLGGGDSVSLMDVVSAIEHAADKPLKYERVPARELLATEPRDVVASKKDIRELLPDFITPFAEGIRLTWDYYANRS